jgi:asparagine synthase (glutamine-hydrolysing)
MCGIAGIFNYKDAAPPVDLRELKRMAETMVHRGPDDEGFYVSDPVGLAHRRLSIIDLKTGHQPMSNQDGSVWVVFNGEIYNHQELRRTLAGKGYMYRTTSDTESILHAYEEYGEGFETHLTGMFAFALWDEKQRRVILSRDRLGIKPLYYTLYNNRCVFASEIKAILSMPGIQRRVDLDALNAYLTLRYVPGPKTMFQNIFKLQPGHTLSVQNGTVRIQSYWDLQFAEGQYSDRQAEDEFESLLLEVCQNHLMSEVPYGVFLSGGVDSSSMVAMLKQLLKESMMTFTVGYENDAGINEFRYARMVSSHANSVHREVSIPAKEFADWIPRLVWHLDEPVGDAACVPLYFLAKYAKQWATVLHSGEGADEILAGYTIYKRVLSLTRFRGRIFSPLAQLITASRLPSTHWNKLRQYLGLISKPLDECYRGVSGHFMLGLKTRLIKPEISAAMGNQCDFVAEMFAGYFEKVKHLHDLNKMLYVDTKVWLPDDLLVKADKMTMAAAVELRVPFLDHRMVEFAARLPLSYKIRNGESKYLLKKVMERHLPHEVIYRSKKGFPVPLAEWFRGELYGLASEVLLQPLNGISAYLNQDFVAKMLRTHRRGYADLSNELWGLLVLEYWLSEFRVDAC